MSDNAIEPRFERGFYLIGPDEAEQVGLGYEPWYAMPAVYEGAMYTSITRFPEVVQILSKAGWGEDVPEADIEAALSVTHLVKGTPEDWKRERRAGWPGQP